MSAHESNGTEAGDGPSHRRVRHSGHDHMSQRFEDDAGDNDNREANDELPSDLRERPTGLFHYWFPSVTMWWVTQH